MNTKAATKFAKEFIDNLKDSPVQPELNNPINAVFNKKILEDDPNLEILNSELNKVGLEIKQNKRKEWQVFKLK